METIDDYTEHDTTRNITDVDAVMIGRVVVPYAGTETVEQITSAASDHTTSQMWRDMPA